MQEPIERSVAHKNIYVESKIRRNHEQRNSDINIARTVCINYIMNHY